MAPVDLGGIVGDMVELYAPLAEEKGLAIEATLDETEPVAGHAPFLSQLVANLLDNALAYTPEGRIGVSLARGDAGAGRLIRWRIRGRGSRRRSGSVYCNASSAWMGAAPAAAAGSGSASSRAWRPLHRATLELDQSPLGGLRDNGDLPAAGRVIGPPRRKAKSGSRPYPPCRRWRSASTRCLFTPWSKTPRRAWERTWITPSAGQRRHSRSSAKPSRVRQTACRYSSVSSTTVVRSNAATNVFSRAKTASGSPGAAKGSMRCWLAAPFSLQTQLFQRRQGLSRSPFAEGPRFNAESLSRIMTAES